MSRLRAALGLFVADVFASVPCTDQRAKGECYLRGLMLRPEPVQQLLVQLVPHADLAFHAAR